MSTGRSQKTKIQRYRRKTPGAKFCNKVNIKKYKKNIIKVVHILRELSK